MAAKPASAAAAPLSASRSASATLTAPLARSSSATRTPAVTPDARMTLAAPRLPLPIRRRSAVPHRRASSSAKGIDPIRYPRMMMAAMARAGPASRGRPCKRNTRDGRVDRAVGQRLAAVQRGVIDPHARDEPDLGQIVDGVPIGRPRVAPACERQVRVERTPFELDAERVDARGNLGLQRRHRVGALADAEPEDARRAVRRKEADAIERRVERRLRRPPLHRDDQLRGERLVRFADERERHVHLVGARPFEGRSVADAPRETPRQRADRLARRLVEIRRNEEANGYTRPSSISRSMFSAAVADRYLTRSRPPTNWN